MRLYVCASTSLGPGPVQGPVRASQRTTSASQIYAIRPARRAEATAEARLETLQITNVITKFGDGFLGWPEQAPFDRILVTAAAPEEPSVLLGQLKPSGVLVAPVGKGQVQQLCRYAGDGHGGFKTDILCEVRFVPLLEGVAREL